MKKTIIGFLILSLSLVSFGAVGTDNIQSSSTLAASQVQIAENFEDLGFDSTGGYETTGTVQAVANKFQYNLGTSVATLTGDLDVTAGMTINESGANSDTRIEGDTEANLLFIDASADQIGIGTATPSAELDVVGDLKVSGGGAFGNSVTIVDKTGSLPGSFIRKPSVAPTNTTPTYSYWYNDQTGSYIDSGKFAITVAGTKGLDLDTSGNLGITGGGTFGGDVLISNTSTAGFKIQDGLSNDVLTVDTDTVSGRVVIASGVSFENNVSTSQDPANNFGVTMQWISNTSLRIKMKGDDGVVRSVDLTLS